MIVEYTLDLDTHTQKKLSSKTDYNIVDISEIIGSLAISTRAKNIVCQRTSVLIDLAQIINSFTFSAIENGQGSVVSVLFDLEPRLYFDYGDCISIYEYRPSNESTCSDPPIERISINEAASIAEKLRKDVAHRLMDVSPDMLRFYETLLRP